MGIKSNAFLVFLLLVFLSCGQDDNMDEDIDVGDFCYVNPPYPKDADTLRILAIGNSFTVGPTEYLGELVDSAHLDRKCCCLYIAYMKSASLKSWCLEFDKNTLHTIERRAGEVNMRQKGTIAELVSQDWDVVVIQQASNISYVWNTYKDLLQLIPAITNNCTNKSVCLVYQLPWSHNQSEMPDVLNGNIDCYNRMRQVFGINVVIPTGIAIQLGRLTNLNDDMYLTMDYWHLNDGIGNYIASCTWYETLFEPVFHKTVVGNTACPRGSYTADEIRLAQECAHYATVSFK